MNKFLNFALLCLSLLGCGTISDYPSARGADEKDATAAADTGAGGSAVDGGSDASTIDDAAQAESDASPEVKDAAPATQSCLRDRDCRDGFECVAARCVREVDQPDPDAAEPTPDAPTSPEADAEVVPPTPQDAALPFEPDAAPQPQEDAGPAPACTRDVNCSPGQICRLEACQAESAERQVWCWDYDASEDGADGGTCQRTPNYYSPMVWRLAQHPNRPPACESEAEVTRYPTQVECCRGTATWNTDGAADYRECLTPPDGGTWTWQEYINE